MSWIENWIAGPSLEAQRYAEMRSALDTLTAEVGFIRASHAEIAKSLGAIHKSLAQLVLQRSEEPEELSNAQRAALIGLPASMADLIDWDQVRRR